MIQFNGTTATELDIVNNATNGTIAFYTNNAGALFNSTTLQNTGGYAYFGSSNYNGNAVNGVSKVQSSATLTTGMILQNTIGNTGDLVITNNANTGTINTYIQSAATSTGSIFISPKGVAALTINSLGESNFTYAPTGNIKNISALSGLGAPMRSIYTLTITGAASFVLPAAATLAGNTAIFRRIGGTSGIITFAAVGVFFNFFAAASLTLTVNCTISAFQMSTMFMCDGVN